MELTATNVRNVVKDCLYTQEEIARIGEDNVQSEAIKVQGVVSSFGFNPKKIEQHAEDIAQLLSELPEEFKRSTGKGGWSFLQACVTKDGTQWGEHRNIDELLCLGLAAKKVEFCVPREM